MAITSPPIIRRDLMIGSEQFALVVQTVHDHGAAVATTAVHRQDFSRRIGGARFELWPDDTRDPDTRLAEVADLARTMSDKTLSVMIPADGQKSVVLCERSVFEDESKKAEVLACHIEVVRTADCGVIFGPDMENPESLQDRVSLVSGLRDHVTGLSEKCGGLSIDQRGYTAQGVVTGILEALRWQASHVNGNGSRGGAWAGRRASIQGFGAVGANTALLLHERGIRVVAVSNKFGAYLAAGDAGLDVPALVRAWQEGGDAAVHDLARRQRDTIRVEPDPNALLDVPADIFVPAATRWVLAMPGEIEEVWRTENPGAYDVTQFLRRTGVQVIAEGANCPLTPDAEAYCQGQGVAVLVDFIINCGGLIGCWREWEARHEAGDGDVVLSVVHARARAHIGEVVSANTIELLQATQPVRRAADEIVRRNRGRLDDNGSPDR